MIKAWVICGITGLISVSIAYGTATELLHGYRDSGAGPFSEVAGKAAWEQEHPSAAGKNSRSCVSCHGADLRRAGRHAKTGKPIEPMALSVNPQRLSDPKKVEKWFRRNCRWTLGRECTPQEKGDFIHFISSQ